MSFFEENTPKIVSTIVLLVCVTIIRFIITTLIKRYAKHAEINEHRAILVSKYISIVIMAITLAGIFMIWGVRTNDIYLAFTSVITIIGVAFFAQWSILSNITAGGKLFFFFSFYLVKTIRIHDKDFPLEGEIDDIKAFHTYLRTKEGELVTYPNNLLLQKGVSIVNTTREEREFMD